MHEVSILTDGKPAENFLQAAQVMNCKQGASERRFSDLNEWVTRGIFWDYRAVERSVNI